MQRLIAVLFALVASVSSKPLEDHAMFPWVYSGKFEGDIVLQPNQIGKVGVIDESYRWPKGVLYYTIASTFNETEKSFIYAAINEYHTRTCIRMVERTDQQGYVYITNGNDYGCYSIVGNTRQPQLLNLNRAVCFYDAVYATGTIIHELLHSLGFWHQMSAPNRDDYITVVEDNIIPDQKINFKKYDSSDVTDFGVGYDYGSIMHYHAYAHSINNQKTIITKDPNAVIGQCNGLSAKDIEKLHIMYNNCE